MAISRRKMLISTGSVLGATLLPEAIKALPVEDKNRSAGQQTVDGLADVLNLHDIERLAKEKLSDMAYVYIESGAADEHTVRWNREALDRIKIQPRVLTDVSKIDTKISLLGMDLQHPIIVAPTAYHKILHPEGELATAKGASAAGSPYVVSMHTTVLLEDIVKVSAQPLWFQLYVQDDRKFTKDLIQKITAQGVKALCITVDSPTTGTRNRQTRSKFKLPDDVLVPYMHDRNMAKAGKTPLARKPFTWRDIEWLKSFSTVPIVLKGILNPLDAEQAIQAGVNGIIVSNHGGRNLDGLPATAEVMPGIADKVGGRLPLLMDGGIRRGTDIVKALAMGADAVMVGRPVCYGLAIAGAPGVTKVIDILKTELETAMMLCGTLTIASIERKLIY